ncbi:unnamed protein product [Linum trigynum]|uniref:F-box domain-containing protein n=1 Tax=Linum trigynum TaxID=586398 RepID=A0AAV2GM35_9ROSI
MEMDYSQLPEDILVKIVEDHLPSFSNLILFSHVCKSWRIAARQSIAAERRPRPCRSGLLLSRSYSDSHEFLPLANFAAAIAPPPRRRLTIRRRVLIPLGFDSDYTNYIRSRRYYRGHNANPCIASKDGWVLVIEPGPSPDPLRLQLLNPVTRQSIPLPPLLLPCPPRAQFTVDNIFKAVISSPPDDGCYVFLVFHFDYENVTLACTNVAASCNEFGRTQVRFP